MKLEKTLAYLESQLPKFGYFTTAYDYWKGNKDGTMLEVYLRLSARPSESLPSQYVELLDALEEVNRELEKVSFNGIFSDLGDKYFS